VPVQPASRKAEGGTHVGGLLVAGVGLLGILGAAGWLVDLMGDVRDTSREISAVQVTQVYTQAGFWALVAIGVLLAGILWVASTR